MSNKIKNQLQLFLVALPLWLVSFNLLGQEKFDYLNYTLKFKKIGEIKTRSANEISSSTWSIGGETLDRDFADYHSYKKYLGPLGAKKIRLQGGWFKCEKEKGKYSFQWMDDIVNDAYSQGVSPCISFMKE